MAIAQRLFLTDTLMALEDEGYESLMQLVDHASNAVVNGPGVSGIRLYDSEQHGPIAGVPLFKGPRAFGTSAEVILVPDLRLLGHRITHSSGTVDRNFTVVSLKESRDELFASYMENSLAKGVVKALEDLT